MIMASVKNKCLICCEDLFHQKIKVQQSESEQLSNKNGYHEDPILRWKLLSLESLCMLFGLPANNSLTTHFVKENGINCRSRGVLLCNQCLGDLSDIHFAFWQLHNLEVKLVKLQKITFERLKSRSRRKASVKTANEEDKQLEEIVRNLFNDIKSRSSVNWPQGVYISRWKEALKNVDRILACDAVSSEPKLIRNVKVEVDQDLGLEDEDYHWDDIDNDDQLESSKKKKTRRKSQRKVKTSKVFEEESPPPFSPVNQDEEDLSDADYFLDEPDIPAEEEEEVDDPDDGSGSDSDYSVESPKKRRKSSQGVTPKPRKINNYKTNSEGKYVCTEDPDICSRTYDVKKLLTIHITNFHKERNHVCPEEDCPQKFLSELKLNSHLKNDHGITRTVITPKHFSEDKPLFLCTEDPDICSRAYEYKKLLTKHIKQFHEGRRHACTEEGCTEKFLSELKLSHHLKKCHGIKLDTEPKPQRLIIDPTELPEMPDKPVFKCTVDPEICNRIYPQFKFLNGHIKRFHRGRNFKCDQEGCVQKFLTQVKLSQHLKLDHGIGRKEPMKKEIKDPEATRERNCDAPLVCDICGITVRRKLMKSHVATKHLGYGRFKCELCGMDFKNGEEIKCHEDLHTEFSTTFPFTCVAPGCTEVLTNSGDLKIHVNKNHLSSGLKCGICGVMKPNKVVLEQHMLRHKKERNLICEECGKAYYSPTMLRFHIESSHLGKKVSCEVCGKEFLRMSSLKRHRVSHQGERRFRCGVCGKAFFNTTQKKRHEQIHAGVKNFECRVCGKRFKQRNNLKQHFGTQGHKDMAGKQQGDGGGGVKGQGDDNGEIMGGSADGDLKFENDF